MDKNKLTLPRDNTEIKLHYPFKSSGEYNKNINKPYQPVNITGMLPLLGDVYDVVDIFKNIKDKNYSKAIEGITLMAIPNLLEKPLKVGKRILFPIKEFGDAPIYKRGQLKELDLTTREPKDINNISPDEDITYMEINVDKNSSKLSPFKVGKDLENLFNNSAHGRIVSFISNIDLSTDSAPLFYKFILSKYKKGLGEIFIPEEGFIRLNKYGNKPMDENTLNLINQNIELINKETGLNIPKAYMKKDPLSKYNSDKFPDYIMIPKIAFMKYDKGGKIT